MSDADDNSNDVVFIETIQESQMSVATSANADDGRPIMQLLRRLVYNDNDQNTLLTDKQIITILQKEYDMDIALMHELELDIYLNVVKKFLKDWPQWDEFDHSVRSLKKRRAHKSLKKALETKYKQLKDYLKEMIDVAKPLAQEAVSKVQAEQSVEMAKVDTSEAILEIHCTRQQLNGLILSQPINNNVFNFIEGQPATISMVDIPLESILNFWKIHIKIELKSFTYTRNAIHQLQHVLVNKKNGERNVKRDLNQNVQYKDQKQATQNYETANLVKLFENIVTQLKNTEMFKFFQILFEIILRDFEQLETIKVPGLYRQHCSKYPYYRMLGKKPSPAASVATLCDLYIEETIAPMVVFQVSKIGKIETISPECNWIEIECGECEMKFTNNKLLDVIKHYSTYHCHEPAWLCSNCKKDFSHVYLTQNRWYHKCEKD